MSNSEMKISGRYFRVTFSISGSEIEVVLPSSYCFVTQRLIFATPGWVFSIRSFPVRAKWELIHWAIPASPDLSFTEMEMGRFRILAVLKIL